MFVKLFFYLNKLFKKYYNLLEIKCPKIHDILFGLNNNHKLSRTILGYFYGICMAFLFWKYIICNLGLSNEISHDFLYILLIVMGLGCAFFQQFRCVCTLIWLGFLGKAGRGVLKALAFAIIISGPIANISENGKETIRVFTCSTTLTYNLTKTRFDLMAKPFHNALIATKRDVSHIKDKFEKIEDVMIPVIQEIESPDVDNSQDEGFSNEFKREIDTQSTANNNIDPKDGSVSSADQYTNIYRKKIENRCNLQLKKGSERCKMAFADTYANCLDQLPYIVNHMLCWPMKITFVCNIAESFGLGSGGRGICDPSDAIDSSFGSDYSELKNVEQKLIGNLSDVSVNYQVINMSENVAIRNAKETSQQVLNEFNKKKKTFDFCMMVVKRILSILFIKVIKDSIVYYYKYMTDIEFDNKYITEYFKRIDLRRQQRKASQLLPIKKIEKRYLIDPTSTTQTKDEFWKMIGNVSKVLLEMIACSTFVILDHLFSVGLELVAKHALIDYEQKGEHIVNVTVNGTGIIAELLKTSIQGFNMKENINVFATNKPCLPQPNILSNWYYVKIYGIYLTILLLIYNESFINRGRRFIMSFFKPKIEKQRILHLYNRSLKKRRGLFKLMAKTVFQQIKKGTLDSNMNWLIRFRLKNEKYFNWLKYFPYARRSCIICKEPEPINNDSNWHFDFVECATPQCDVIYCHECWNEIGQMCLVCHHLYFQDSQSVAYSEYTTD